MTASVHNAHDNPGMLNRPRRIDKPGARNTYFRAGYLRQKGIQPIRYERHHVVIQKYKSFSPGCIGAQIIHDGEVEFSRE